MYRFFLALLAITFILHYNVHAQQTAQAEMKIYVRVLEGKSITNNLPKTLRLNQTAETDFGILEYNSKDSQNTIFHVSRDLFLTNVDGHQVHLQISGQTHFVDNAITKIRLVGKTSRKIQNGLYKGALRSVVEYL